MRSSTITYVIIVVIVVVIVVVVIIIVVVVIVVVVVVIVVVIVVIIVIVIVVTVVAQSQVLHGEDIGQVAVSAQLPPRVQTATRNLTLQRRLDLSNIALQTGYSLLSVKQPRTFFESKVSTYAYEGSKCPVGRC